MKQATVGTVLVQSVLLVLCKTNKFS